MKRLIWIGLSVVLMSAPSFAQDKPKTAEDEVMSLKVEILKTQMEAKLYALAPDGNKDKAGAARTLSALYRKAALLPGMGDYLAGDIFSEFSSGKVAAKSAPQVSQAANEASVEFQFLLAAQNQVIIEQNKRMIELLEAIAKRPGR